MFWKLNLYVFELTADHKSWFSMIYWKWKKQSNNVWQLRFLKTLFFALKSWKKLWLDFFLKKSGLIFTAKMEETSPICIVCSLWTHAACQSVNQYLKTGCCFFCCLDCRGFTFYHIHIHTLSWTGSHFWQIKGVSEGALFQTVLRCIHQEAGLRSTDELSLVGFTKLFLS